MDRATASSLRQRLHDLRLERDHLEEELLGIRAFLRGSLVAHHTLSGGRRRPQPAFYLFRWEDGRRRSHYIRKEHLEKARRDVDAYRRYREGLLRLRALGQEILEAFQSLSRYQEVASPT
jgi:hypothetical protein